VVVGGVAAVVVVAAAAACHCEITTYSSAHPVG
jgi:hypothetical protein